MSQKSSRLAEWMQVTRWGSEAVWPLALFPAGTGTWGRVAVPLSIILAGFVVAADGQPSISH